MDWYLKMMTAGGLTLGYTALPTDILLVVAMAVMFNALAASVKAICSLHPALPVQQYVCMYMNIRICMYTHTHNKRHVCMYAYVYVCMCIYMYTHVEK
jgi:hypothetical protein